MASQHLIITIGQQSPLQLRFKIRSTPVAQLWVDRMQERNLWPMDDPQRFYGFDSQAQEQQRGADMIQQCISTINSHEKIINRDFEYTQDCLNYLHNIFERYHGLLDAQTSDYWQRAPDSVRQALANLNIAVHRCESAISGNSARFVCTWFGMPKLYTLDPKLQSVFGESQIRFGTVYLNYCEIGKTVEDLANDNDSYIADEAFKPFSHYSADFNVQFNNYNLANKYGKVQRYIDQHQDFFIAHGIKSVYNVKARPVRFPVADLVDGYNKDKLLSQIAQRQYVQQVELE